MNVNDVNGNEDDMKKREKLEDKKQRSNVRN